MTQKPFTQRVYIELATGAYPLYEGDVRLAHPEIGDVFVCPDSFAEVKQVDAPEIPVTGDVPTQGVQRLPPKLVDGVWTEDWAVVTYDQETVDRLTATLNALRPENDKPGAAPNVIG